jgi:hypothetical protein
MNVIYQYTIVVPKCNECIEKFKFFQNVLFFKITIKLIQIDAIFKSKYEIFVPRVPC